MRTSQILFVAALLACWPSAAGAQQATGQQPAEQTATSPWHVSMQNWFDAGVRITTVDGDRARFERYRDPRTGPFLDRLRFEKDTGSSIFALAIDNVGYRDQRLFGQYNIPGKMRVSLEWNQVPQFWSHDTRSPYTGTGTAIQNLPAGLASAVQANGSSFVNTYRAVNPDPFDTRARRDTLTLNVLYNATRNLDLNLNVLTSARDGSQPWSVSFGFGNAAEVTAPVETRTTDLTAGAEWANDRGMLRVAYDGSWFNNSQPTLVVDNPSRATDIFTPTASVSSRARSVLWPSNTSNTVTGAGAVNLAGHSRVSAMVSVGNWKQDEPLQPLTINTAIPVFPLPRNSADTDIRRVASNVSFVTRPVNFLSLNARYRFYDFKDETPVFNPQTVVEYDALVEFGDEAVEPGASPFVPAHFSNRYNTFEADATVTRWRPASFTAGYRLNRVDYTDREIGQTTDHAGFASVDSRQLGMVSFHGRYEHDRRRAEDFNTLALEELPNGGEYPGLRRFDVSDRDRDTGTAMVQVMPASAFAVSASVTAARDKFPNLQFPGTESFGLQRRTMTGYGLFLDVTPRDTVIVSGGYGYQTYQTDQQSRQVSSDPATPAGAAQKLDPRRNWTVAEDEKVHYVAASVELTQIVPKTALRVTYDFNKSDAPYVYGLVPGSPITAGVQATPGQPPVQLPAIGHNWHTATVDLRYFFRKNAAAGVMYWFDRYRVDDQWSMGSNIVDRIAVPGLLLVGYGFRPYTANSVWLRVQYFF